MKKFQNVIFIITCIMLVVQGCKSNTNDHETVRQEVLDRHDELMSVAGTAINIKMRLDTLDLKKIKHSYPQTDTTAERKKIALISSGLMDADGRMSDWMHEFKSDYEKTPEMDASSYYNNEKTKIVALDSIYKKHMGEAADYLKRFDIEPVSGTGHEAMKM